MTTPESELQKAARLYSATTKCDILFFNGPIGRGQDDKVIDQCEKRCRHENVLLILTTQGGSPDAAYRIARYLQRSYKKFSLYVPGYCKSAGTLVAIGAHELILSRHTELGPLDVQVPSAEVGERSSGLTPGDALEVLHRRSAQALSHTFQHIRFVVGLPTQQAAEVSAELVGAMYREVFSQIDPLQLGYLDRANRIAVEYGDRLQRKSKNLKDDALARLVSGYPSHGFVIDKEEALELFHHVRMPVENELIISREVDAIARAPLRDDDAFVFFISPEPEDAATDASPSAQSESAPPVDVRPEGSDNDKPHAPGSNAGDGSETAQAKQPAGRRKKSRKAAG